MTDRKLPPLPIIGARFIGSGESIGAEGSMWFNEGHMHAYATQAVLEERERHQHFREALETIAAQSSGKVGSTALADCMAAIASSAIRACVGADRAAAQVEPVKMLTEFNIRRAYSEARNTEEFAELIQRKFCAVNAGRTIPADGVIRAAP